MARMVLIEGGVVKNIVSTAGPYKAPDGVQAVNSETANIGDLYDEARNSFASGAPAASHVFLDRHATQRATDMFSVVRSYTSGGVVLKADALPTTLVNLSLLAAVGTTASWVANDFSVTIVTGAEFAAILPMVGAYMQTVYAMLATVLGEIAAGTITSMAEIDAVQWPA